MSAAAILTSSARTSLLRYRRSWGLWLILLVAPVGARYMISDDGHHGVQIAIGDHLPVLTWPVVGVWLGIVVSTLLLPVGYAYLRANTTRRQPWQIEEVTAGSRIAIALGRMAADGAILLAVLATLTVAGWFLASLLATGPIDPVMLTAGLWIVAAPPLVFLGALRILFDALPWLRGRLGDVAFFFLWMSAIVMPAAIDGLPSSFKTNMVDFAGYYRPLVAGAPDHSTDFAIGATDVRPGKITLDVAAGLGAPGYLTSRAAWLALTIAVAALAGLLYRPHRPRRGRLTQGRIGRLLVAGPPRPADPAAVPASRAASPFAGLVLAEARLIGAGRIFKLLAVMATLLGLYGDYRHVGSPAALLLLVFAFSAHAGRCEARGLLALTRTTESPPTLRRLCFVLAGCGWSLAMALPAAAFRLSAEPLLLALETGAAAALVAICLATLSRSAFAPRLVLLIGWYAYFSA